MRAHRYKMPNEVATLCFHTRDAVQRDDSTLTFTMPSDRLSTGAAKVALASCEFPMVQWTVEEEWNRLYIQEGIRIDDENNFLGISLRIPGEIETSNPICLTIPPRFNVVCKTTRKGSLVEVECARPHGLVKTPALSEDLRLVGSAQGDVCLGSEWTPCSAHSFRIPSVAAHDFSHLFAPTVPTLKHLCALLTAAATEALASSPVSMLFRYDESGDRILLNAQCGIANTVVRILPGGLANLCGLSMVAQRLSATSSLQWPCEATSFWDYVEMPPGFYAPCHRPMCVGQPMRFGPELELAINRFYFPLLTNESHVLVFTDPEGRVHSCSIPSGRFTPETLCVHLERGMTAAARQLAPTVTYSVYHNEDDRFVFSCEQEHGGRVRPAKFGILFHHPKSVDPTRFGFSAQPLSTSHTYVAPRPTRAATVICSPSAHPTHRRRVANILRVSEITPQKRFRLHGVPPPPMIGIVQAQRGDGGASTTRLLLVRTYVNGRSFAHGFQAGDVVKIAVCAVPAMEEKESESVKECPCKIPTECTCVVLDAVDENPDTNHYDACLMSLRVPALLDGLGDPGVCVQLTGETEPWSMHFAKPRTLPAHLMGFPASAVLWGHHGTVSDDAGSFLPPFEAPFSHCLDHPDYVLITFSESSGANFEHSYNGESKQVFCKLSLYPLFREERMLPRDTTLLQTTLTRFTLSFWNPDMRTPYKFHGAQFSFSLNFVSSTP